MFGSSLTGLGPVLKKRVTLAERSEYDGATGRRETCRSAGEPDALGGGVLSACSDRPGCEIPVCGVLTGMPNVLYDT